MTLLLSRPLRIALQAAAPENCVSTVIAASTPPSPHGTLASFRPISTPESAPISDRSESMPRVASEAVFERDVTKDVENRPLIGHGFLCDQLSSQPFDWLSPCPGRTAWPSTGSPNDRSTVSWWTG